MRFNYESAAIYEYMHNQIGDLKEQLEQLLPEEKKSGNKEDVLLHRLEKQLEKVNAVQVKENWTEIRADLEFFETLEPFVQEKIEILKKLAEWEQPQAGQIEPNDSPVPYQVLGWEWRELLPSLDKAAQLKLDSLTGGIEAQKIYQEQQRKFNNLKSRALTQLEPAVFVENLIPNRSERRPIFDRPIPLTIILGSMTVLVAALAYEWHLYFLHSSHHVASS